MELRKRYQLKEGDPITLIDLEEGVFLSSKTSVLPRMAAQIESLQKKNGISLAELIDGVRALRNREK